MAHEFDNFVADGFHHNGQQSCAKLLNEVYHFFLHLRVHRVASMESSVSGSLVDNLLASPVPHTLLRALGRHILVLLSELYFFHLNAAMNWCWVLPLTSEQTRTKTQAHTRLKTENLRTTKYKRPCNREAVHTKRVMATDLLPKCLHFVARLHSHLVARQQITFCQ